MSSSTRSEDTATTMQPDSCTLIAEVEDNKTDVVSARIGLAKRMVPPPPRFAITPDADGALRMSKDIAEPSATAIIDHEARQARSRAVSAAARAASSALPAQRERAVNEAAAAAYTLHMRLEEGGEALGQNEADRTAGTSAMTSATAEESFPAVAASSQTAPTATAAAAPKANATYEPPSWSGLPTGVLWTLETIRNGSSLGVMELHTKPYFTMGRTPNNDVEVEHPSASRLHAVIQFKAESKEAFLYDVGSAHGTQVNRRRIKPHVHVPLRVGDMIRLGASSRDYVVGGPPELMPAEGPSKAQRLERRLLQAKKRRTKEAEVGAAQMEAALATGGGVSWGFREDAIEEGDGVVPFVDWRTYSETKGLTDKQEKIAVKVRRKEITIQNLTIETERIRVKGANDELTAGQASTLARNERTMDLLKEEIEDLEETLNESVQDSISGRRDASREASVARRAAEAKRKKRAEEEEIAGSSDDDEFYDRTAASATGAAAAVGPAAKKAKRAAAEAMAPGALFAKAEVLSVHIRELKQAIAEEAALVAAAGTSSQTVAGVAAVDPAAKEMITAEGIPLAAVAAAARLSPPVQSEGQTEEEEDTLASAFPDEPEVPVRRPLPGAITALSAAAHTDGGGVVGGENGCKAADEGGDEAQGDALDAFMSDVVTHLEADKVGTLRRELAAVEQQEQTTRALLRVADPDGFFVAGSVAGRAATAKAAAAAKLEAQHQEALEKQRRALLAKKEMEAQLAARTAAEVEEVEVDDSAQPTACTPLSGLELRGKKAVAAATVAAAAAAAAPRGEGHAITSSPISTAIAADAGTPRPPPPEAVIPAPVYGLEVRQKWLPKSLVNDGGPRRLQSRAEVAAAAAAGAAEPLAASLDDDLDILARARRGGGGGDGSLNIQDDSSLMTWKPLEQQKGDGRTALNDKFGY